MDKHGSKRMKVDKMDGKDESGWSGWKKSCTCFCVFPNVYLHFFYRLIEDKAIKIVKVVKRE